MNEAEQRLTQVRAYATQCIKEEAEELKLHLI